MALNIKNEDVEQLVIEVVRLTGESKTEAVKRALIERKERLSLRTVVDQRAHAVRFLEREVWPVVPKGEVGRRLTTEQEDAILGYGPQGA